MKILKKVQAIIISLLMIIGVNSLTPIYALDYIYGDDIVTITYISGLVTEVDPLALLGEVKIDDKSYSVTDDFEFNGLTKHWIEKPNTPVVCKLIEGKIADFYSQDDIAHIDIETETDPKSLYFYNGKINTKSFKLNVNISYVLSAKYDFIPESILKKLHIKCDNLLIKSKSDGLNFGSNGFGWFKNYKTEMTENLNSRIFYIGNHGYYTYDVYVNDNYKLKSVNSILNIESVVNYSNQSASSVSQISVGNLDIEKEKVNNKKSNTIFDKKTKNANNILDQNVESAIAFTGTIDGYLSLNDQKYIRKVLYVWVSDIFATSSSSYCKNNNSIKDKVYKKLGIEKNILTDINSIKATFSFVLNTNIGKRTIRFNLTLNNFSFGGKPSYAGFGILNYTMYKNSENNPDCQGTGTVALTNMKTFTDNLIEIANTQIKSIFKNTIGNDLDKIVDYLTEGTLVQVLKETGVTRGTFSDNVYKLLAHPTENYLDIEVNCPVDVYVYDSQNKLIGKIINDTVEKNNDIYTYVSGSEKHIYLFNDNYHLVITGNDNGKMDYIINEMSSDDKLVRKISYNNLPVVLGESYYSALPHPSLQNSELYNPMNKNETSISPSGIEESDLYNYDEPTLYYTKQCGENVFFDYYSNGFCFVYGSGEMYDYQLKSGEKGPNAKTNSPFYGNQIFIDNGVTSIGDYAFKNSNYEYIYLGDSVEKVGDMSVYNSQQLKKIHIGSNVKSFGDYSLSYCPSLEFADISPDNNHFKIQDGNIFSKDGKKIIKFINKSLDTYTVPSTVEEVSKDAFGDNLNLKKVVFQDGLISIDKCAFDGCTNLNEIVLPDSLENIHTDFKNTGLYNDKDNWTNNALYINNHLIAIGNKNISNFIVRKGVKTIADNAFNDCMNLTNISLPNSLVSIGNMAFSYCKKLQDIKYPNNLKKIGNSAFWNCINFKSLKFPNSLKSIGNNSFGYCEEIISIYLPNITVIGDGAFSNCYSLNDISFSNSVKYIGENAFEDDNQILNVYFQGSVTDWCNIDFKNELSRPNHKWCDVTVTGDTNIPTTLTKIENHQFCGFTCFDVVDIPEGVQSIGNYAFDYCQNIVELKIPKSVTSIGDTVVNDYFSKLVQVSYGGNENDWKSVTKGSENERIMDSKFHYNCTGCSLKLIENLPPSCSSDGYKEYKCSVCNETQSFYFNSLDHEFAKIKTVPVTCTNEGYDLYICSSCGKIHKENYRKAFGHKFINNKCSNCGYIKKTIISLKKSTTNLYVKGNEKIIVTIKNGIGKTTYKSSNSNIARVDKNGRVYALKAGTVRITVTNNKVSRYFTVKVSNPRLNKTTVSLKRGKSYTLKITGQVGVASYKSANTKIAVVNSKGVIKINKKAKVGLKTYIFVKTNGISLKCIVKVVK
ncbi:leucine-rich repeat protein [Ruminococcus sp. LCP21S3_E8]